MSQLSPTLIIGVGNVYRNDDGVGVIIARRLQAKKPSGIRIVEQSGEGTALMEAWRGAERVIIIDAVQSGAKPGTIHHLDARARSMPSAFFHYSTHAFSIAEAIEMARVLGQLPAQIEIYGIEGKNFEAGETLSPEVDGAAEILLDDLL